MLLYTPSILAAESEQTGCVPLAPESDRLVLTGKLLQSLESPNQAEVDKAWLEEAERRLDAYRAGALKAIPADEVFRSLPHRTGR